MTAYVLHANDMNRTTVADNCRAHIGALPVGKSWRIEIKQYTKPRTSPQCRYLNGVAYKIIGDELGFERDDVSEFLCGEYFGWVPVKRMKGYENVPRRTTTTDENGARCVLSRQEFADYVAFVQRWAMSNKGIYVPDPNESADQMAA